MLVYSTRYECECTYWMESHDRKGSVLVSVLSLGVIMNPEFKDVLRPQSPVFGRNSES